MKLFNEEQVVLDALLVEWRDTMDAITKRADGIFSDKALQYDRTNPVWERIAWPEGFVQELRKKIDRLKQLLEANGSEPKWSEIEEELCDILNYSRMFAAINRMVYERKHPTEDSDEVRTGLATSSIPTN